MKDGFGHGHGYGPRRHGVAQRHMEPPPESTAAQVIRWGKTASELGTLAYNAYQAGKVVAPIVAGLL